MEQKLAFDQLKITTLRDERLLSLTRGVWYRLPRNAQELLRRHAELRGEPGAHVPDEQTPWDVVTIEFSETAQLKMGDLDTPTYDAALVLFCTAYAFARVVRHPAYAATAHAVGCADSDLFDAQERTELESAAQHDSLPEFDARDADANTLLCWKWGFREEFEAWLEDSHFAPRWYVARSEQANARADGVPDALAEALYWSKLTEPGVADEITDPA